MITVEKITTAKIAEQLPPVNLATLPATVSGFTFKSIANGASNYRMLHLCIFLQSANAKLMLTDITNQRYYVSTLEDAYRVIGKLIKRYRTTVKQVNKAAGVYCTQPKDIKSGEETSPLTVSTFLGVINYFKCELEVING